MKRVAVETPERLVIYQKLAGPGPRIVALMLDVVIQGLFIVVAVLVVLGGIDALASRQFGSITIAFYYILLFVIQWGYFTLWEIITRGRSPGKAMIRIRVVRGNGEPLEASAVIIRNLLRAVDSFPFFYLVGGLVASIDSRHRRLGDFAADTIVIHEPTIPATEPVTDIEQLSMRADAIRAVGRRLSEDELYAIRRFLASFRKLPGERQLELATTLAVRVAERLELTAPADDPVGFLEGVYRGHAAQDGE